MINSMGRAMIGSVVHILLGCFITMSIPILSIILIGRAPMIGAAWDNNGNKNNRILFTSISINGIFSVIAPAFNLVQCH